ncbi:MAG TPA: hypothetical protein DCE24_08345 [Porphyromonadaceae bacterium]|nr:hypothetical protein [Porphyromonadaceae bacterium]
MKTTIRTENSLEKLILDNYEEISDGLYNEACKNASDYISYVFEAHGVTVVVGVDTRYDDERPYNEPIEAYQSIKAAWIEASDDSENFLSDPFEKEICGMIVRDLRESILGVTA